MRVLVQKPHTLGCLLFRYGSVISPVHGYARLQGLGRWFGLVGSDSRLRRDNVFFYDLEVHPSCSWNPE